jgi:hypothetical protein
MSAKSTRLCTWRFELCSETRLASHVIKLMKHPPGCYFVDARLVKKNLGARVAWRLLTSITHDMTMRDLVGVKPSGYKLMNLFE